MEENIAILMADLSGYTALTETHGAESAADLIDKYVGIVENCLVGDTKLHERTGDEVMIVSRSADLLLASARKIIKETSREENFLQVHGGLHYGKVLPRRNSYFGTAINLTARIASKADAGRFWCSKDFVQALSNNQQHHLQSKGMHSFKNVTESGEMYELADENRGAYFIDSVCRMVILNPDNSIRHPQINNLFFCSAGCLEIYKKNHA